jgi:hypothetical protein
MSENVTTLGSLLVPEDAAPRKLLEAAGADDAFAGVAKQAVESFLPDLGPQLMARLREVLDVPVPDVLAGAWGRSVDLLKYRDPERYPAEKVSLVPLAPHTVNSRHRPTMEVEVSGVLPTPVTLRLALDVELTAKVEGAKIAIQGGKIRKLMGGTLHLTGTLFAGDHEIGSGERTVRIPGEVRLGEGIPIVPAIPIPAGMPFAGKPAATAPTQEPHPPTPAG